MKLIVVRFMHFFFQNVTELFWKLCLHCKPIPWNENRISMCSHFYPVIIALQGSCFHYRESCYHCRDSVFITEISLLVPCSTLYAGLQGTTEILTSHTSVIQHFILKSSTVIEHSIKFHPTVVRWFNGKKLEVLGFRCQAPSYYSLRLRRHHETPVTATTTTYVQGLGWPQTLNGNRIDS